MIMLGAGWLLLGLTLIAHGYACKVGDTVPVVGVCRNYKECDSSGIYQLKSCGPSESFDPILKTCKYAWNVKCVNADQPCTKPGTKVPVAGDCSSYFECGADNEYSLKSCGALLKFDVNSASCGNWYNVNCSNTPLCSGNVKVPLDGYCKSYRECVKGKYVKNQCQPISGSLNLDTNECDDSNFNCSGNVQCDFGPKQPISDDCTSYIECIGNRYVTFSCGLLSRYDPQTQTCVWRWKVDCENEGCVKDDIQPALNHTEYFLCLNGYYQKQSCGQTDSNKQRYYDVVTKKCGDEDSKPLIFKGKCDPDSPRLPFKGICSFYYECKGGEYMLRSCQNSEHFNIKSQVCSTVWNNQCTKNQTDCGSTYYAVPDPANCSSFYECQNHVMQRSNCGLRGYLFDSVTNTCQLASLATCWTHKN